MNRSRGRLLSRFAISCLGFCLLWLPQGNTHVSADQSPIEATTAIFVTERIEGQEEPDVAWLAGNCQKQTPRNFF